MSFEEPQVTSLDQYPIILVPDRRRQNIGIPSDHCFQGLLDRIEIAAGHGQGVLNCQGFAEFLPSIQHPPILMGNHAEHIAKYDQADGHNHQAKTDFTIGC